MQLEHWIAHTASRTPDKVAIRCAGQTMTYRQLEQLIGKLAWLLRHRYGVSAGDRVAHLTLNNPYFLALLFACARVQAILVPLNFRLAGPELAFMLNDARPRVLFGDSASLSECGDFNLVADDCRLVALDDADESGCDKLILHLDEAGIDDEPQNPSDPSAPFLIVYTSGTTGRPKGAVLDQNAIRWNALNSQHMHALTSDDHVLTVLPFFHVGGINIQTLPVLHHGGTVTLLPQFDPEEVLATIAEARTTLSVMVPTQMQALAASPRWARSDLSSLRAITTGSTRVDPGLLELWHERGIRTLQVYGCTESGPIAVCQGIDDRHSPAGSAGRKARYCDVRLVDENGLGVPIMARGEIQLSGPNIMRCYWNNAEGTTATLQDGWLATGDIGFRDEAGNYFVVDRIKNMIISGGENIYPAEIERVLLTHADIDEAAVVGLPDSRWGESVAVAIVMRPGSDLDEAVVLEFLNGRVGRYKIPRHIVFLTELPRNAMGKTDYDALRSEILSRI